MWYGLDEFTEKDFPVAEEKPVYVDGKVVKNWIAIVNARDGYVYNIASKWYKLVQHRFVFDMVADTIREYGYDPKVQLTYTHRGARMYAKFVFQEFDVMEEDTVRLGVIAKNSYDGSMSVNIGGYGFRLACSNGMVFPLELIGRYTPHVGSVEERIREMVSTVVENMAQIQDILTAAAEKKISRAEAIKFIEDLPLAKSRKKQLIEMLPKEEELPVWEVYNTLTYHFTHEVGRMSEDRAYQLNSKAAKILIAGR